MIQGTFHFLSLRFASFELQQGLILTIQQTHGSTIAVSIWCLPSDLHENHLSLILETWDSLRDVLTQCMLPHSPSFELLCPHWRPGDACSMVKVEQVGVQHSAGTGVLCSVDSLPDGVTTLHPVQPECICHRELLRPTDFGRYIIIGLWIVHRSKLLEKVTLLVVFLGVSECVWKCEQFGCGHAASCEICSLVSPCWNLSTLDLLDCW